MIYCVIPPELEDELYDRLVEHYASNSNVQVIIDRRKGDRRSGEGEVSEEIANRRETRERRRARPGSFPRVELPNEQEQA